MELVNAERFAGTRTGVRIERILCPVDFSEVSAQAYRYTQSMADHYHATLVAQHIVELWQHPSGFYSPSAQLLEFRRNLVDDGQNDLQQFVRTFGGIQADCVVQEGSAADAILCLARERTISLIVLGTHGRRGFDRLMLGSVTERVLRHSSCPVLAIRQSAPDSSKLDSQDDSVLIRRILCCVDFSAHSERALQYALSLADVFDAEVIVLHVLDGTSCSSAIEKEAMTTRENFEKLIPPAAHSSKRIHLTVRLGKAYQEILQFASEVHSDVIVTGVHGRHALDLAVFGSTSYRVIQLGPVPVLAVPI